MKAAPALIALALASCATLGCIPSDAGPGSGSGRGGAGGTTASTGGGGTLAGAGGGGGDVSGGAGGTSGGQGGGVGAGGAGVVTGAGGAAGGSPDGGVIPRPDAGVGGGDNCTAGAAYNPAMPPTTLALTSTSGNALGAHDPSTLLVGDTIYLVATGLGSKTSRNLTAWTSTGNPLPTPSWVAGMVPGARNLWAPDLSFFGGVYHLYYAASTFSSNRSCIGHATRAAMDSGAWADTGGPVVCSNTGTTADNWNAIDPNVVIDDVGTPWLAFGSFWGGLKMIKLDQTGARADTMLYSIAARPNARGALEGPFIFKRCGYYYLFTSFDACCDGAFDYNMRVGRATAVTGPYVDKAGVQMMQGGGTLLVQGNGTLTAPGHNAILVYNGRTYNVYHALNAQHGGASLHIAEIVWDAEGWPISGGP